MPKEPYFEVLRGGYDRNFTYLLGCPETLELALIDCAQPWSDLQVALQKALELGFRKLTKIFLTHAHHDHILSLNTALTATGAQVYAHAYELERLRKFCGLELSNFIRDREFLTFGKERLKAFHTPGHQPSSVCFVWRNKIFTGDTLFIGGCGRCDLPGGELKDQLDSMKFLANELPDELTVYPGHDYGSKPSDSLGEQKRHNKYLRGLKDTEITPEIEEHWLAMRSGQIVG